MTDDPGFPGVDGIIFDTWKIRSRSHFHSPSIPHEFCPKIGAVAIAWGYFEVLFENLFIAVLRADGVTDEKWRGLNFRKRRSILTDRLPAVLPDCPTAIAEIISILDDLQPIYLKRNLAVHGRMGTEIRGIIRDDGTRETEVKLVCVGRYAGRDVTEKFTVDQLDDLFYDIGCLSGRMLAVSLGHLALPPTSPETQRLLAFLSNNHPTFPTPATLVPPPSPSPGSAE